MGRELRMVPPNWNHPKSKRINDELHFVPMFDETYDKALADYQKERRKWLAGERPDYYTLEEGEEEPTFEEYNGEPPKKRFYRPWKNEEATWFQVWETVSEGTPVSPPFETKQELIDYLVVNGDFWDQSRRKQLHRSIGMNCDPWTREQAEAFVNNAGWTPSFVLDANGLRSGVQALSNNNESN